MFHRHKTAIHIFKNLFIYPDEKKDSLFLSFRGQGRFDAHLTQLLYQLSTLVHLKHYITASNEFSLKINLRDCWPVAEFLDALSKLLVSKHIVARESNIVHSHYLTDSIAESTLGSLRNPFHENHHLIFVHHTLNSLGDRWGGTKRSCCEELLLILRLEAHPHKCSCQSLHTDHYDKSLKKCYQA